MTKKISLFATSLMLSVPALAYAATIVPPCSGGDCGTLSAESLLTKVIGWILVVAASIAVLALIVGGVMYITAAGNDDRTKKAKATLLGAIIGLVVIVLAYVIVAVIVNSGAWFGSASE